jgi:scyllo-inositol 2-dehydrogenase (NADP+)
MNKIQTALAAYGLSGEVFHAPLLASHPGFALKTIVSRTDKASQKYPHVPIVRDFTEMLRDETLELIIINTPNATHFDLATQALEAGKHVVVEKPFTVTTHQAWQLVELSQKKNKLLTVFQNRRWDGDFKTIQQIITDGWLGELVSFESHFDRFRNFIKPDTWKETSGEGSGMLYDLGSHLIDQSLVLFGRPQTVTARQRIQRTGGSIADNFEIMLEYPRLTATLKTSFLVREPLPKYILQGQQGSFVKCGLDVQEEALRQGKLPGVGWGKEPESEWGTLNTDLSGLHFRGKIETLPGSYPDFYENLYQAIRHQMPLAILPEQALQTMEIIEAALQSDKERRTVFLG